MFAVFHQSRVRLVPPGDLRRPLACLLLIATLIALLSVETLAQRTNSPTEAARIQRKAIKEYADELTDQAKFERRNFRKYFQPNPEPGKGWRSEEFDVDKVSEQDLGVEFDPRGPGITLVRVYDRSMLAEYGFRRGDVIVAVDGHRVQSLDDFFQFVFGEDVRWGKVKVTIVRGDREGDIRITPMELLEPVPRLDPLNILGVTLGRAGRALRVDEVRNQSPADAADLRPRDEIVAFDGVRLRSADHLRDLIVDSHPGVYDVQVDRGGVTRRIEVELPAEAFERNTRVAGTRESVR